MIDDLSFDTSRRTSRYDSPSMVSVSLRVRVDSTVDRGAEKARQCLFVKEVAYASLAPEQKELLASAEEAMESGGIAGANTSKSPASRLSRFLQVVHLLSLRFRSTPPEST